MDDELIIKFIDKLHEKLKGTQYEFDVLETKREIEDFIENAILQAKANRAYEDYLEACVN